MKKFFKVLLLAAVALMPVMGMAQTADSSQVKWEREMRMRQYADSVERARLTQLYAHQESMAQMKNLYRESVMRKLFNEDLWLLFVFAGGTITIVILCLRHSRRKAEDHKELINKLIDNNLLNSTEPISKEAIEALMKPKKSEKDKIITDATLMGLGLGIIFALRNIQCGPSEILELAAFVLLFLGALRLVIRTISMIIAYIINKKKEAKTEIDEAEIVEEK